MAPDDVDKQDSRECETCGNEFPQRGRSVYGSDGYCTCFVPEDQLKKITKKNRKYQIPLYDSVTGTASKTPNIQKLENEANKNKAEKEATIKAFQDLMDSKQFLVENNAEQAKRHRQEMEVQREQMEQMGNVIREQAAKIALQEQTRRKTAWAEEFRCNTEGEREEYNFDMWSPTSGESIGGERDNVQVRQSTVCESGDYGGPASGMKRFESQSNLADMGLHQRRPERLEETQKEDRPATTRQHKFAEK